MIVDLPTPPLPLVIAKTRVRLPGPNGLPRAARPPRSRSVSAARCSGVITERVDVDRAGARDGLGGLAHVAFDACRLPGIRRSSAG